MKKTLIRTSVFAMSVALLGACAAPTSSQLDEIRAMAESAQSTANNASSQASRALATANEALDAARQAQATANSAMDCCNANSSKIDRAFNKAMMK